jgi:hypothetical protein
MTAREIITKLIEVAGSYPTAHHFDEFLENNPAEWVERTLNRIVDYGHFFKEDQDMEEHADKIVSRVKDSEREAMYAAAFIFRKLNLVKKLFEQKHDLDLVFSAFMGSMLFLPDMMSPLEFVPALMDYLEVACRDIPPLSKYVFDPSELFSLLDLTEANGFPRILVGRVLTFFYRYRPLTATIHLAFHAKGNGIRAFNTDVLYGCSLLVFKDHTRRTPDDIKRSILWVLEGTTSRKETLLLTYLHVLLLTRNHDKLLGELVEIFSKTSSKYAAAKWFMHVFEDPVHPPSVELVNTFVRCGYTLKRFPKHIPPGIEYGMGERKTMMTLLGKTRIPDAVIRDRLFRMLC